MIVVTWTKWMSLLCAALLGTMGCGKSVTERTETPSRRGEESTPQDDSKQPVSTSVESAKYPSATYQRLPLTDAALRSTIKEYSMERVKANSSDADNLLADIPPQWSVPSKQELEWYAWPHNRGHEDRNLQLNFTMAVSRSENVIYLFVQNYDVTP